MQNQSGSFVSQQFVQLKILPSNHPKTLNAIASASDYSFSMVSTFSTQLYNIKIFFPGPATTKAHEQVLTWRSRSNLAAS
jgi:hypothetical protein